LRLENQYYNTCRYIAPRPQLHIGPKEKKINDLEIPHFVLYHRTF